MSGAGCRRVVARLAASLLLAGTPAAFVGEFRAARADGGAWERYWLDRDAKGLAAALTGSVDPSDREAIALCMRVADPSGRALAGGADTPLVRAVDALRRADPGAAASLASEEAATGAGPGVRATFLLALAMARQGRDEQALARLIGGPAFVLARDGTWLALVFAALPEDDRDLAGGLIRAAITRAGAAGRADLVTALAEASVAIHAEDGALAIVAGARVLRRTGRPADALALLDGAAAGRAGRGVPAFAMERAILAWRRNEAAVARAQVAGADTGPWPWARTAFARAGACCAVIPAPPLPPVEGGDDLDALAIARALATLGIAVRPEDVTTRAAASSTTPADPAFVRRYLDAFRVARLETAGDPATVEAALSKGLPVLVWRPRRDGERFVDRAVLVRGHDVATGLLVADEPDPRRLDVFPSLALRKARAIVLAGKGREHELDAWKGDVATRRGAFVMDGLARLFGAQPVAAAAAFAARPAGLEDDPVLDHYAGYAIYAPAFAAHDPAGLAAASALLRRASSTAPITSLERLMRAEASLGGEIEPALAELAEAEREEGAAAWIELTRFVIFESGHRHADALAALDRARRLDPLDVRTLYFRAGTRRLLGDGPGGKADLVRVLERRPDHVPAAEDLASTFVDEGAPERALAVVRALVAADPAAASTRRVHQLRQRVEARLVRRARSADDLLELATSPEPDVRAEVAWTASSFETDAAERLLRGFLVDEDESVRRRAATAYQRPSLCDRASRDPALRATLASRLAADPAAGVRESLARALFRVDAPDAAAALAARLSGPGADPAVGVRVTIAELFSTRDAQAARGALVLALSDAESTVRAAAIGSLRRLTGTSLGFEPDDPPERRAAAIAEWNRRLASGR